MTLLEETLQKLTKDELVNLSLEYQIKCNLTLANTGKDMGEVRNYFEKLEADLAISWSVNNKLRDRIISLECQCWSNSQYSRCECLEITDLPDHWLLGNQNKNFIIRLSKCKDANKI